MSLRSQTFLQTGVALADAASSGKTALARSPAKFEDWLVPVVGSLGYPPFGFYTFTGYVRIFCAIDLLADH